MQVPRPRNDVKHYTKKEKFSCPHENRTDKQIVVAYVMAMKNCYKQNSTDCHYNRAITLSCCESCKQKFDDRFPELVGDSWSSPHDDYVEFERNDQGLFVCSQAPNGALELPNFLPSHYIIYGCNDEDNFEYEINSLKQGFVEENDETDDDETDDDE